MHSASRKALLSAAAVAVLAPFTLADVNNVPGTSGPTGLTFLVPTTGATALASFTSAQGNTGGYLVGYARGLNNPSADVISVGGNPLYGVRVGNSHYSIPTGFSSGQLYGSHVTGGPAASNDRMVYTYHNTGSINGVLNVVRSQGLLTTAQSPVQANNPLFVNGVQNNSLPATGGVTTLSSYTANMTGANTAVAKPNIAWSDVAAIQGFAVDGSAVFNAAPAAAGYGKGRPNAASGFSAANVNMQALADVTSLDDPTDNYAAGAATLASRVRNDSVVVAPFTISANPGTGLDSVSEADAKFLNAVGRIQNGANFNVSTRDIGSGTRNQAGNNLGLDPSWASGERDRRALKASANVPGPNGLVNVASGDEQSPVRNLDGTTGGTNGVNTNEHRPSAIARYADKTSGSTGVLSTITHQRMALGVLSTGDAARSGTSGLLATEARPLRALAIDWNEEAGNLGEPVAGPVQPTAFNVTEGFYQMWSAAQAVTVIPVDANGNAVTTNAIQGDIDDVAIATNGAQTGPGIARKYLDNITQSVSSGPSPVTAATPFDALIRASFIPTTLMGVNKGLDGTSQVKINRSTVDPDTSDTLDTSPQNIWQVVVQGSGGTPTLANSLNWVRAGNNHGSATAQRYRIYDVGTGTNSTGAPAGDLELAITLDDNNTDNANIGNALIGDFNRDNVRDFRDTASLARAYGNTAAYLAANPTVSAAILANTGKLQTPAGFNAAQAGLLLISDFNGDGNVVVVDNSGNDVVLAKDYSNAEAFANALGENAAGAISRDRVETISRADVRYFLYGASVDTDPSAPTFDGSRTLGDVYNDAVQLNGRPAGDTAQNRRELGVRFGKIRKNAAVITFNNELDTIGGSATALKFNRFDVNDDGALNREDAKVLDRNIGKNFTNLADVLGASDDLIAAELTDDNVITHIDPNTSAAFSGTIASLGFDSDFQQIRAALATSLLDGDTNFDGSVGFVDLVELARSYSTSNKKWSEGDFDFDGNVGFLDLVALSRNYGATATAAGQFVIDLGIQAAFASDWALAQSMVPEPTTLGLIGAGAVLTLRRRRR